MRGFCIWHRVCAYLVDFVTFVRGHWERTRSDQPGGQANPSS